MNTSNNMKLPFEKTASGLRAQSLVDKHGMKVDRILTIVKTRILESAPAISGKYKYITKYFWSPAEWSEFPIGIKIAMGLCLAHLVDTGAVPLKRVYPKSWAAKSTKKRTGTQRYCLLDQ